MLPPAIILELHLSWVGVAAHYLYFSDSLSHTTGTVPNCRKTYFWPKSVLHLTCTNPNILNSKQEQQTVPLANTEGPLLACAVQPPATCLPLPVCSPAPVCSCLYSPVPQELTESQKTQTIRLKIQTGQESHTCWICAIHHGWWHLLSYQVPFLLFIQFYHQTICDETFLAA